MAIIRFLVVLWVCWSPSLPAQDIRPLAFINHYYPKPGKTLQDLLTAFFTKVRSHPGPKPRMIIAPHDQLVRSGLTAAIAYQSLQGHAYKSIFLIGPYHKEMIRGISIWDLGNWQGPKGILQIDHEMIRQLKHSSQSLQQNSAYLHFWEHSLENQLPFLQEVLANPLIVPILISHNTDANALAMAILEVIKEQDVLIILSTDLSHFHTLQEAQVIDLHTLTLIQNINPETLKQAIDDLQVELCGSAPVLTGLEIARQMNWHPQILHYATNTDTTHQTDSTVGYTAITFFDEKKT